MSPLRRLAGEALRFLGVGLVATIVALIIFNVLVHGVGVMDDAPLADSPVLAYVIGNGIGMAISYHGSRSWAFKEREVVHADGGATAFVVINLATMTIPIACLWFSRDVLGLDDPISDNISANVIGLVLSMLARFYLFRRVVFLRPEPEEAVRAVRPEVPTDPSTSDPARRPSS